MKRLLLTLSLLALAIIPTLAQEATQIAPEDAVDVPRVLSVIETVKFIAENDQPMLLIYGRLPDTCERDTFITKERQGTVLFVDVYHAPVPPSTVPCPEKVIPLALSLPVDEILTLDDDATLPTILAVNDHYYRINIAQVEPVGNPPAVPPITLTPLQRTVAVVDAITPQESDDGLTELQINGILASGCADTPVTRVMPTSLEKTAYVVSVFQLLDDPQMCPDTYVAVQYELLVKTSAPFDSDTTFTAVFLAPVEEVEPTAPLGDTMMRVPHVIESVDALLLESFPVQISLTVKGHQPDGCGLPVQTTQSRDGNTVTVNIFRDVPSDIACPMMIEPYEATIKLDGGFESGTYTIDVNGTVITVKI